MEIGTCKFFNGSYYNKECLAGVNYDSVTPDPQFNIGKALRVPCRSKPSFSSIPTPSQLEHFNNRGKCAKYTDPTELEVAEHHAAVARWHQAKRIEGEDRMTRSEAR